MLSDATNHTPAAHVVGGDDDLLSEILLRLPIRPLVRFKSVSKHWLSLISNPTFSLLRNSISPPNPPISGLLLQRPSRLINPDFDFVPLNKDDDDPPKPPFRTLNFVDDRCGLRILQSCNGLLCCCTKVARTGKSNYYIYNPTTNKFTTLPDPNRIVFRYIDWIESVCAVNIAFDPSKSPHYKVVCVYPSETLPGHYEIEIYSSETRLWTPSGDPFYALVHFRSSVYWNGSIHWMSTWDSPLYFNLNMELIGNMPIPPMPEGLKERRLPFLCESSGHLHLIVIYVLQTTHLILYEMDIDYSKWFVKYHVDLDSIPNAFPEMISSLFGPSDICHYGFVVMDVVRGDKDEDPFLVLHIPGKAITYNFGNITFKKLCDFIPDDPRCIDGWLEAFQYVESLASV